MSTEEHAQDLERSGAETAGQQPPAHPTGKRLALLSIATLGVVYGDIGTSPLYALRESFHENYGLAASPVNVIGILSLIFWALVLVISVKYLIFILQADNRGEGGILALTALVTPLGAGRRGGKWTLILLGLFGAALLYGDGMITPAISVLSAIEGLQVATPVFRPMVIPITIGILFALFLVQRHGTARVGGIFGPVTMVWFVVLALLGVWQIGQEPSVLAAVSPLHAFSFFAHNGLKGVLVLGSVFLVVTGGEALYADMGHFGRRPIRLTWFAFVLPALVLNYFGQGALLIRDPTAIENPFYRMGPDWSLYPLVFLATAATVIASQAVISGAFSLSMQSVQFGYVPRLEIQHTSETEIGQIYVPAVNWALMLACIGLVIGFKSSSNLAAAYGVAVTTTMVITTMLFFVLARERWRWPLAAALGLSGAFMVVDISFFGANLTKIPAGGWFPIIVATGVFTLMTTWKRGRAMLAARMKRNELPLTDFIASIHDNPPHRVPGTAVFMFGNLNATPRALLHNLKHNKALHDQVVCLAVVTEEQPHVPLKERCTLERLPDGFYTVVLHYGFMQDVNVPQELARLHGQQGLDFRPMETTYFLGRENLIASREIKGMAIWREKLFIVMSRNARGATAFFRLPPNRVVEIGAQVEI